jgi:hypothetical protein
MPNFYAVVDRRSRVVKSLIEESIPHTDEYYVANVVGSVGVGWVHSGPYFKPPTLTREQLDAKNRIETEKRMAYVPVVVDSVSFRAALRDMNLLSKAEEAIKASKETVKLLWEHSSSVSRSGKIVQALDEFGFKAADLDKAFKVAFVV